MPKSLLAFMLKSGLKCGIAWVMAGVNGLSSNQTATYIIGCCSYFHKWYFVLEQIFHMLPAGIIFKHVLLNALGDQHGTQCFEYIHPLHTQTLAPLNPIRIL